MTPVLSIVEDHDIYRRSLCDVVRASDEWRLGSVASSAEEAMELFAREPCDLALVDLSLPDMNGFDLVRTVRRRWPHTRCLMLSGHDHERYATQAFDAGAVGYVVKGSPRDLRTAIRQALSDP